jgi:hypothetical protein
MATTTTPTDQKSKLKVFLLWLCLSLCLCASVVNLSCGSKPADLRSFIPADSLIYLESNDLGAVMNAITERPAFREAAKEVPDLSAVKRSQACSGRYRF